MKKTPPPPRNRYLPVVAVILIFLSVLSLAAAVSDPALEISDYPTELSLEKGWLKYVTVHVNNTGSADLRHVTLSVEGIPRVWVEQQTGELDILPAGSSAAFSLKITVPLDTRTQRYIAKFAATSDEASDEKISDIKVFGSKSEVLLQEIQTLRSKLNYLGEIANIAEREGKNATLPREKLNRANEVLTVAESYLYRKMYDEDIELLRTARALLDLSEKELESLPEAKQARPILAPPEAGTPLALMMVFAAVLGSVVLFFAFKSAEKLIASRARRSYIRELKTSIREAPAAQIVKELPSTVESYMEEKAKLMRLLSGLESDYKTGKLSKESFSELKLKYEGRIAELASIRRRDAQQASSPS